MVVSKVSLLWLSVAFMCGGFAFYSGNPLVENLKLDKLKIFTQNH